MKYIIEQTIHFAWTVEAESRDAALSEHSINIETESNEALGEFFNAAEWLTVQESIKESLNA